MATERHCRKCGVGLVDGENWYPSYVKRCNYICIECKKACDYQWRHSEEQKDYQRQYYNAHLEEKRQSRRQWREANTEERREYQCQWIEDNPDYIRQWCEDNPDRVREHGRRRRARKNGATIGFVDERAIYELYNNTCIYCGATESLTLDHVVPLAGGGTHSESNLVIACRSCNCSKRDKPLMEWLQTQPRSQAWAA